MGRLIYRPPGGAVTVGSHYCTTCGTNGSKDHKPDSNECIEMAHEKTWSQSHDD